MISETDNEEKVKVCTLDDFDDVVQQQEEASETFYPESLDNVHNKQRNEVLSLLSDHYTTDMALARDLAYFGATRLDDILNRYNITKQDLLTRLNDESFKTLVEKFKQDMTRDVHGTVRLRAGAYLDSALDSLYSVAVSGTADHKDIIKAVTQLAYLADAMPKTNNGNNAGTGVAITFNFGEQNPLINTAKVVEIYNEQS